MAWDGRLPARLRRTFGSAGPLLIPDIPPDQRVISPVDGTVLTSRADVREHNRRNGVEDVGNDPAFRHPDRPQPERSNHKAMLARVMRGEVPVRRGLRLED